MLVYLILAFVSGLSPWVANPAMGTTPTAASPQEAVALPAHQQSPGELLYLSRVEAEPDNETKTADPVTDLSALPLSAFFNLLLAECYSALPPVNTAGLPVPHVAPTGMIILHQVFRI